MRGSSPGGCSGQWMADGGGPRRTEGCQSGGRGAAVVLDARGARGKGKGEEWEGLEPKKITATKNE
jgi:hypothetical protein